ncbi:hypothetical protein CEXT_582171 [Caerostris extrusa]|uniref:Secreted protein n=1 Tax=Caerostris extrusa TaxID=172846 RepID=A0AAV4MB18_CAEEX|nr:hypothetical protein CEXT_582171 [Caerostris extrusa]
MFLGLRFICLIPYSSVYPLGYGNEKVVSRLTTARTLARLPQTPTSALYPHPSSGSEPRSGIMICPRDLTTVKKIPLFLWYHEAYENTKGAALSSTHL